MRTASFFEFLRKQREENEKRIYFYCDRGDFIAEALIFALIGEAKKHVDLGQGKHVYMHKANIPNAQDHLHFYQNKTELFALNKDGTAHDQSHGKKMANWTVDAIKAHYPDFQYPKSKLIEQLLFSGEKSFILESAGSKPLVSKLLIQKAERDVR